MTEPIDARDAADRAPDTNRFELVFYAEGVVDRSNENQQHDDDTEESR